MSRWIGVLEIQGECYIDESPLFYDESDPYVVRFKVYPIAWPDKECSVPIHDERVWRGLSFTRNCAPGSASWTGKVRTSLNRLSEEDGAFLEQVLVAQQAGGTVYLFDEEKYRRSLAHKVRRPDKVVSVTVPEDEENEEPGDDCRLIRDSSRIQGLLASIGEQMGFKVWLPKNDRTAVLQEWKPEDGTLINTLPLNYDETTLNTIEQIDVFLAQGSVDRPCIRGRAYNGGLLGHPTHGRLACTPAEYGYSTPHRCS
jgi:hypothetical protein